MDDATFYAISKFDNINVSLVPTALISVHSNMADTPLNHDRSRIYTLDTWNLNVATSNMRATALPILPTRATRRTTSRRGSR